MNLAFPPLRVQPEQRRADIDLQLGLAERIVPPLWPLDGAIAVNPLTGFEDIAFEDALREGGRLFDANAALPLAGWRALVARGRVSREALRAVAIEELGGHDAAFALLGPNVSRLDCLMARLLDLPESAPAPAVGDAAMDIVAKWCAAYFDGGVAAAPMPGRSQGLYRAVLRLIGHDPALRALAEVPLQPLLRGLPRDPVDAIIQGLDAVGITEDRTLSFLRGLIARLPGWAGHVRWRQAHADADRVAEAPATMAGLVALQLLVLRAAPSFLDRPRPAAAKQDVRGVLLGHFGLDPAERYPLDDVLALDAAALGLIFQRAAERGYRDALLPLLARPLAAPVPTRPDAQVVMCIDVRSEPFRRALEREGRYETFGYAGFFGLMIAVEAPNQLRRRQLPVLVEPQQTLAIAPVPGREAEAAAAEAGERRAAAARDLFATLKSGAATAFSTAEAVGPLAGALMAAGTLFPRQARALARSLSGASDAFAPVVAQQDGKGLTLEERIGYARALFVLTGMAPERTAPIVVLAGHRGQTVNNPYGAAYDCGACAGHGGADNARAMAAILNESAVRAALAADGMVIPADTVFIPGEHDTTVDEVALFDTCCLPEGHRPGLAALREALARAGAANRARRATALARTADDLAVGAAHWGEVRPEWGLAGNAAFIVGPRALTSPVDLEGRSFLHSYDWRTDVTGEALATILTAPMVVAQWINCQYLFSTVDNRRYGAGDKAIHNPVGRLGVVRGNGGDLCVGLPMQALFDDEGTPVHVPQRLLTIVSAPFDHVERVVAGQSVLRRLFGNGWVQLIAIDPETGVARRWRNDQEMMANPEICGVLAEVDLGGKQ